MNQHTLTAARAGLLSCHTCDLLVEKPDGQESHHLHCPRCHSALHSRIPDSLSKTWALVLTAFILYIPANLLPVMTVIQLGSGAPKTILGGVIALYEAQMWPLALIVFVASVVVPLMKLLVLIYLLISVRSGSRDRLMDRTQLYRVAETFGHWSMVDVFLVGILVSVVQLDALATIEPGLGASFFGAVVVITMFAAKTFDPRLIWDVLEERNGKRQLG
ncbi:MAG: paraquat-inducible protein A [Magnetococcales bacterium]|nr:paraquat-inducible protein A [Magnetococcales bacterium]